jgi:hypothetical protein
MSLTQSSVLYQSNFADGVQGLASVRIKSDVPLKVCSIQAGVVSTTNCVNVVANNKWGFYKVPFILGATSNGISIASTGAVTGTVYIDDAFVGATSLTQEINIVSPWTSYGVIGITNGTKGTTTTDSVKCRTVGSNYECEYSYQQTVAGAAGAGDYIVSLPSGIEFDSSQVFYTGVIGNVTNVAANQALLDSIGNITQSTTNTGYGTAIAYDSTRFRIQWDNLYTNRNPWGPTFYAFSNAAISFKLNIKFRGKGLSNSTSVYTSTNSDTDWASCGHTTSSFTGFGTVSAIETQCKRQGDDLLMKGKFTTVTGTATELRLALPVWNGVQLASSGTTKIPSLQLAGKGNRSTTGTTFFSGVTVLMEPSVSYVTFGGESSTLSGDQKALGSGLANIGPYNWTINARIPIEGWQQSNILIGQFSGLESCSSTLECTDTFSASVTSTGTVVSGSENVDWIDGNCSFSTGYLCNFKTGVFTATPNCVVTPSDTAGGLSLLSSTSATSVTPIFISRTDAGSTNVATNFRIICQKQGVDYIGKTAKAVASDQNMRIPGATKAVQYVEELACATTSTLDRSVSGTSMFQSLGNLSAGNCSFTLKSGLFAEEPYCFANYIGSTGTSVSLHPVFTTATTGTLQCRAGTTTCTGGGPFNVTCIGVSP